MFQPRPEEREYALLNDPDVANQNRYGQPIDLIELSKQPVGLSLRINGDEGVGDNPNRYKQHGFHFTADNCIGCHACEAACSEKNDLPAHLSFRSVGYVEGGTYPNFTRMNISMACNHCDDPVCLKGCPTRAYTKHAEYGAVIQDPDICFGCGYCTWVCPYNAPQLDPVAGQVEKCNMCVDRLEVGLKPACVSACLGGALDFGVIENTPTNREQTETTIPGFPTPDITHPNIRFQQTKSVPREFTRTDSAPVKYHKDDATGRYAPTVDTKHGKVREWNLRKLSSRENPLVIFTLVSQAVIGAFAALFIGGVAGVPGLAEIAASNVYIPALLVLMGLQGGALFLSTQHLGKPIRFYRGFNNLRHSPLSREALGVALFMASLGAHMVLSVIDHGFPGLFGAGAAAVLLQNFLPDFVPALLRTVADIFGGAAVLAGLAGLYFMQRIYRIKARPFWNHWQVAASFFGTMLSLGGLLAAIAGLTWLFATGGQMGPASAVLSGIVAVGLALEAVGLIAHRRDLIRTGGEGLASYYVQTTTYAYTYAARNLLLGSSIVIAVVAAIMPLPDVAIMALWGAVGVMMFCASLAGRALFYVLVIPTTMPGAFFWKNQAFQEHARETGLAHRPQVGVTVEAH